MQKLILGLARVRLWAAMAVLTMGMGMGACQQPTVLPNPDNSSDSTTPATHQEDPNPDPPEKPFKPGGGN
jgi:hypothetical protein